MWWPYYWHPISLHYTGWSYSIRVVKGWKPWELRSCRSDENTCSQMMRDGETTIIVGGVDRKTWMRKRWRTRKIMDLWEAEEGSAKTAFKVAKSKNFNCCPKLNSFSLPPRKVIGFWILDFFEMNERWTRWLKITEKVSFKLAGEASYVYILSGQKLIENAKNGPFWRVFENLKLAVKQYYQTGQF